MGNYQPVQEAHMTLAIATISDAITDLSVTGLTIKDIDEIPQAVINRDCPLLVPNPDNYVSRFLVAPDSFGVGSSRKWTASYTLNYLLLYAAAGSGRTTVLEKYSGMVTAAFAFFDALLASSALTGTVDFEPDMIGDFGMTTFSGTSFHSCGVSLNVKEFVN